MFLNCKFSVSILLWERREELTKGWMKKIVDTPEASADIQKSIEVFLLFFLEWSSIIGIRFTDNFTYHWPYCKL